LIHPAFATPLDRLPRSGNAFWPAMPADRCRLIVTVSVRSWTGQQLEINTPQGEIPMTRTVFAMAVAGLIFGALSETPHAAPLASFTRIGPHHGGLTTVAWRHVCVRNNWGRLHCRWIQV
jgi:hypothetical protein